MRQAVTLALALGTAVTSAWAEDRSEFYKTGLRPFVGVGFTSGGDTLLPVTLVTVGTNVEYKEDVSAGGGLDLRVGLSYRLGSLPLTLQAAYAYHNDKVSGIDGEYATFRRFPLELLLQWHFNDRAKLGFGVRRASSPSYKIGGNWCTYKDGNNVTQSCDGQTKLKASTGLVLEGEYALTPSWGLKARYVHESFKAKDVPALWQGLGIIQEDQKFEADHVGVITVWYFN